MCSVDFLTTSNLFDLDQIKIQKIGFHIKIFASGDTLTPLLKGDTPIPFFKSKLNFLLVPNVFLTLGILQPHYSEGIH